MPRWVDWAGWPPKLSLAQDAVDRAAESFDFTLSKNRGELDEADADDSRGMASLEPDELIAIIRRAIRGVVDAEIREMRSQIDARMKQYDRRLSRMERDNETNRGKIKMAKSVTSRLRQIAGTRSGPAKVLEDLHTRGLLSAKGVASANIGHTTELCKALETAAEQDKAKLTRLEKGGVPAKPKPAPRTRAEVLKLLERGVERGLVNRMDLVKANLGLPTRHVTEELLKSLAA